MRVKAKRAGWDEQLTPEQEFDFDEYDSDNDELEGELEEWDVPESEHYKAIRVCLVGGQPADPKTVQKAE